MSRADSTDGCASDETLIRMATGTVPADELEVLREHVDDCSVCGAALLVLIRASASSIAAANAGMQIGRFTINDVLGSGSMGTVFTASDPQLDRSVAIKVLRGGRDSSRLLREAKAMARVRHPNVVTVYEVGEDQDVVFVAMEQVRGATLRARLADRNAPIEARIDWLLQIAQALDAIHAAGLVHRDLKPDNVFVEDIEDPDDGSRQRVVVGDFGLAATSTHNTERGPSMIPNMATRSAGTPAYMGPEQLQGEPLDARADIFAFGVTAWEVLTGARPFDGRTAAELETSIERGPARSAAFEALPGALAAMLARCVRYDRDQRPGTIREVTRVLEAARGRRRHRLLALGVAATACVLALTAIAAVRALTRDDQRGATATRCDPDEPARWNTTRPAWVQQAQHLSPFVRDALVARMDQRASAWSREATAACKRDVLAQQAWASCRPRLEELEQRVLVVAVESAWPDDQPLIRTLDRLAPPAYCASSEASEDAVALSTLPSDAARVALTDGLGWLVRADALDDVGAHGARDQAMETAARITSTIAPSPLDGELALSRVVLDPPSVPAEHVAALQAVAATAERSGRASLIARTWLTLAERAAQLEVNEATIASALQQADWAITRLGDPPRLRVRWLSADGSRAWARGEYANAKAQFAKATQLAGTDRELAWTSQLTIAKLAAIAGDDRKAAGVFREFLADSQFVTYAGAEAQVAIEAGLADALYHIGELAEAQQAIERAIERGRKALAPNHPQQITNQLIAASIQLDRGQSAAALSLLEATVAQSRASLGPDHVITAAVLERIAQTLIFTGKTDDGLVAATEAARIFNMRQGRLSEGGITARFLIADARRVQGKLDTSAKMFAEVLADAEALYGTEHPMWAQLTEGYANALIGLGRNDEARALLERSIPVLAKGGAPDLAAYAKFALAKIVLASDRARAIALATEAEAGLAGDPGWAEDRAHITAWLRRQARRRTPH